ncbi:MAG: carbohydrate-binding family 9-like protein [Deltaproteobacteria bacterium]|nr:carbohydrate-binding family 9-like protein [Deltaproteobacteria bacterium]
MTNVARWMMLLALAGACVEQPAAQGGPRGVSQSELEAVRRRVASRTEPHPQHALPFNWDGKVRLLGYDIDQAELRPGQRVTITWYWQCLAPVGDGWRLFTHLDDSNGPRTNEDNIGDVRRAYQPERWRAGEFIRDAQTFELPQDWDSPVVKIHVGVWKDTARMAVTPEGETDGTRRARTMVLNTGVRVQVAELTVGRATGTITPDGRLDEPAWAGAVRIPQLVNTGSGNPPGATDAHASARMLWDDQNLYVAFEVADENLVDPATERDAHLWEHDTVEVMVDPDGDGRNYFELQVSPRNQRFDTRYDAPRDPQPEGHKDYNPAYRSGVVTNGTIGNSDDTDTGYTVEMAIAWSDISQGLPHNPPVAGDALRLNLFVMDEDKTGGHRAAGWSAPHRGDFHTLERFGRVTLAAEVPGLAPQVAPSIGNPVGASNAPVPVAIPGNGPAIPARIDPTQLRVVQPQGARRPPGTAPRRPPAP